MSTARKPASHQISPLRGLHRMATAKRTEFADSRLPKSLLAPCLTA